VKFRNDIEGLRGIAVLLVVLSHLEIAGFDGGFIGVDIFFVISGFLITSLICNEYASSQEAVGKRGSFSLTAFYLRRVRRIVPLSLFVLVSTSVASYLLFNSARFDRILTDSIWAALFAANIRFIRLATDYFQQGFSVSPIQHYWSLAVEEQFYMFFPVLLFFSTRVPGLRIFGYRVKENHPSGIFIGYRLKWNHRAGLLIGLITACSLFWSITQTSANPTSSYFSSLTRAWEIGIGGLIAVLVLNFKYQLSTAIRTGLAAIGLELILLATLRFDSTTPFPGISAFVPVGGAALVIFAGSSGANVVTTILGNKVLTLIGRISFSLYLWHWPLIVITKSLNPKFTEELTGKFTLLVIMFVLSYISFKIIEQPFRKMQFHPAQRNRKKRLRRREMADKFIPFAIPTVFVLIILSLYVGMSRYLDSQNTSAVSVASATLTTEATLTQKTTPVAESDYAKLLAAWQAKIADGSQLKKIPPGMRPNIEGLANIGYGTFCQLREPDQTVFGCSFGNTNARRTAVILGDSFAAALTPMVVNALDPKEYRTISLAMSSCPVGTSVPSVDTTALSECDRHRFYAIELIEELRPDFVILGELPPLEKTEDGRFLPRSNLESWESGLGDTISKLNTSVGKMIYMGTQPLGGSLIDCVGSNQILFDSCFVDPTGLNDIRERQRQILKNRGVLFIDPVEWLCQQTCPPIIDFTPVRRDDFHISVSLAERLAPLFRAFLVRNSLL
jgi:peptidoglycan/LPS O-acetylase OafA/YrhL